VIDKTMTALPIGKGLVKREGSKVAILNFGTLLGSALQAGEQLDATVVDMRFVKPLDKEMILSLANSHELLVTLEENSIAGGAGSAVSEFLAEQAVVMPILQLGLPDQFIDHCQSPAATGNGGARCSTNFKSYSGTIGSDLNSSRNINDKEII
jgi:1-deoxy-D-xylulose-5-phosphate synthase